MCEDNRRFFSAPSHELADWAYELGKIKESTSRTYSKAFNAFERWQSAGTPSKPPELAESSADRNFFLRIVFYLMLRARRRYAADFIREQTEDRKKSLWWQAFESEKITLTRQIDRLRGLRARQEKISPSKRHPDVGFVEIKGDYSKSCTVVCGESGGVEVRDVRDLPRDFCDVIVVDPPYGFNTNEDFEALAKLYAAMIEKMIVALREREGGQLVIAVPDWSHTGRQLPLFALKGLITQQILIAAEKHSKEVVSPAHIAHPSGLFKPPYYWESERALRRVILHFRIKTTRT
jgi:hypothetical protein